MKEKQKYLQKPKWIRDLKFTQCILEHLKKVKAGYGYAIY